MSGTKYQYLAAFIVTLMTMACGVIGGWLSPSLPLLSSDDTPLDTKLTVEEASLIAALASAGGLVGNLLFAWISNQFGRKTPLMFISVPNIIGWILTLYAKNAYHLYGARFALGLVGGGAFVIVPLFLSEVAEDRVRGTLGSFLVLSAAFGGLLALIFGDYCSYLFTPIFAIVMTLVFLGAFSFFPESPVALYKMNRIEEAEKSVCFYRNFDRNCKTELEALEIEMNKLRSLQINSQETCTDGDNTKLRWADFTTIAARKAMMICLMLVALNQLCGCPAMGSYTATIFMEAGSTLTPNGSATVVGCIQLIGAYVSTILVDWAGRKFLLALSAILTGVGLACLGTYMYLKSMGCHVEVFGWIPIACLSFVVFFAHWGLLTLPFLVMSEIFPEKIKNAGTAICLGILSVLAFILIKFFPMMSNALGMHGSMLLFASISMVGAFLIMVVMPETKGKSYDEIMKLLER